MPKVIINVEDVDGGISLSMSTDPEIKEDSVLTNAMYLGAAAYQYLEHILKKAQEEDGEAEIVGNC